MRSSCSSAASARRLALVGEAARSASAASTSANSAATKSPLSATARAADEEEEDAGRGSAQRTATPAPVLRGRSSSTGTRRSGGPAHSGRRRHRGEAVAGRRAPRWTRARRPTSTPSSNTPSASRGPLHVPGHKGGPGPIRAARGDRRGCAAARHPGRDRGDRRRPRPADRPCSSRPSASRPRPGARSAAGSWSTAAPAATTRSASRSRHLGERVVVQRNVHSSIIDGLVLSGLRPRFVARRSTPSSAIAHCLTPEALDEALDREPDAVAAMIVSPTYFGAVADVAALAEVAHRAACRWSSTRPGARTCTSPPRCPSARSSAAPTSSSPRSTRSSARSPSRRSSTSARADAIDERVVDRAVTLVESTSPNALLTARWTPRGQAATQGEELLAETVASLASCASGSARSTASTCSTSGSSGARRLRLRPAAAGGRRARHRRHRPPDRAADARADDINLELFSENVVVAVFGIGERAAETGGGWSRRCEHACERLGEEEEEPLRAVRRATALGPDRALPARGLPRRPGGGRVRPRPRGGSPPSRSPPIRPGCRTSSRASASRARRSTTSPTPSPTAGSCAAPATGR